jgi:hypothetical protein
MNREDILEAWAPVGGDWSLWARPVLFAQMEARTIEQAPEISLSDLQAIPSPDLAADAALVVDLPGVDSVKTGLALALKGYRPVPMYNGCTGNHEVVNQSGILEALAGGAKLLAGLKLHPAPPAFLIDSLRMSAKQVRPGDFDNRWKVFPQDFPAGEILIEKGIRRVIVLRARRIVPAADLVSVLIRWQAAGIRLEACDMARSLTPQAIELKEPWWARLSWRRVLEFFGLNRGPRKGFGHIVPEPTHG